MSNTKQTEAEDILLPGSNITKNSTEHLTKENYHTKGDNKQANFSVILSIGNRNVNSTSNILKKQDISSIHNRSMMNYKSIPSINTKTNATRNLPSSTEAGNAATLMNDLIKPTEFNLCA